VVEFPDLRAHRLLGGAVGAGEGVELVDETLRMDPAQRVMSDIELSGGIAEDHALGEEAMRLDGAPKGAFGGQAHRIGRGLEFADAEPAQMIHPVACVGEALVAVGREPSEDRRRHAMFADIGERLIVDDIVGVTGAQAFEKVQAALRIDGAEPGEAIVADLGADRVAALVAGAGVVKKRGTTPLTDSHASYSGLTGYRRDPRIVRQNGGT